MPFTTISKKILCEDLLPLFPLPSSPTPNTAVPMSVSYYEVIKKLYLLFPNCSVKSYLSWSPDDLHFLFECLKDLSFI